MKRKYHLEQLSVIEDEGVTVLGITQSGSGHKKIHCRYQGKEFFLLVSNSHRVSTRHIRNLQADVRRIARAIANGDTVILEKYLGRTACL